METKSTRDKVSPNTKSDVPFYWFKLFPYAICFGILLTSSIELRNKKGMCKTDLMSALRLVQNKNALLLKN